MAAPTVGYAVMPIVPSLKGMDAEIRRQLNGPSEKAGREAGKKAAKGFRDSFKELKIDAQSLTSFGTKAVAVGGVVAFGLGKAGKAANSLNAAIATTPQIFDQAASRIQDWSKRSAEGFGLSRRAALEAAASFGAFGKQAGLEGEELVSFSTQLTELAADLAAFKDTTVDDAIVAIQSGLTGEQIPLRRYQILLDDATLRQRAFAMGITETTTQALTPQQRVLAAHAQIMAQSVDMQGQFMREQDQLGTSTQVLTAQWEDAQAALGQALLPALTSAAQGAAGLLGEFKELSPETQKTVSHLVAAGAAGTVLVGGLSLAAGAGLRLHDAWTRMKAAGENGNRVMAAMTNLGRDASGSLTRLGIAARGAGLALGTMFVADLVFDVLNEGANATGKFADEVNRLKAAVAGGDIGDTFAGLVAAEQNTLRLQNLWQEFGAEVDIVGTGVKADVEQVQRAFDSLGQTEKIAALDDLERRTASLDRNSRQYKINSEFIDRNRESLRLAAAAEDAEGKAADNNAAAHERQAGALDDAQRATDALETALAGLTARQTLNTLAFDAGRVAAQSYMDAIDRSTDVDNLLRSGIGIGSAMRDLREGFFGTAEAATEAEDTTDRVAKAMQALDDALTATNPDLSVSAIAFGRMSTAADAFRASLTGSARFASQVGAALGVGEAYRDFRLTFRRLPEDIDTVAATLGTYRKRQTEAIHSVIELGDRSRDYLSTLLETGRSHDVVRREAERLRQEFVRQFRQAGMNEKQIRKYLDLIGLAPESVETAIKLSGVEAARFEIESYLQLLEGRIPESVAASVTAKIRAGDLDSAARELAALAAKNPVRLDVEVKPSGVEETKQDLIDLPRHFDFAKAALGGYTEAQEKGLEAVLALGDATKEYLSEVLASRGPEQARAEADRLRESFRKQFEQLGITGEAFDEYADKLLGLDEVDVEASIALAGFDRTIFEIETLYALLSDLGALSDEEKILLSVAISKGDLDLARQILTNQIGNWNDTLAPVELGVEIAPAVERAKAIIDAGGFGTPFKLDIIVEAGGVDAVRAEAAKGATMPLTVDEREAVDTVLDFAKKAGAPVAVTLDADTTKAVEEHLRYISLVTGIFPEVPLDADDTRAVGQWLAYVRQVTSEDVPVPLDADDNEAWQRYLDFVHGVGSATVEIPVGLDMDSLNKAMKNLREIIASGGFGTPYRIDILEHAYGMDLNRNGIIGRKYGGIVPGSGSGDIVPAMLEPGEYVVSRQGVQAAGLELLERINAGRVDTLAGSTLTSQVASTERRGAMVIENLHLHSSSPERAMEDIVTNGAVWAHAAGFGEN